MARRASSGIKPTTLLLIAVLLAAGAAVTWAMLNKSSDPFDGITELDIGDYMDNAPSFQGNVYRVQGTVIEQLKWTPDSGRLFNVEVGDARVGIKVPPEFSDQNIQTGQSFLFKIRVERQGILIAEDIQKS